MRIFLIIIICFSFLQCSNNYELYNNHPFVYIEFDIPDIFQQNIDIPLSFLITNRENEDIIINRGYLTYYLEVYDSTYEPLIPKWLEERNIKIEPIKINKKSSLKVDGFTIQYNKYNFQTNQTYIIQAKYRNVESYSDSVISYIGEIGPYFKKIKFTN